MWQLLADASDTVTQAPDGITGGQYLLGLAISGALTLAGLYVTKRVKKRKPISHAESEANLTLQNLRTLYNDLRQEFTDYRNETEKSEGEYRKQVGIELASLRQDLEYERALVALYSDDGIDVRIGFAEGRYPPPPPRPHRPPRMLGPAQT